MAKRWKEIETEVCRLFGGRRAGPTGREGADCIGTGIFSVQVKHLARVSKTIVAALEQAEADAPGDTLPVAVVHKKRSGIGESLVVIRLSSFREWYL